MRVSIVNENNRKLGVFCRKLVGNISMYYHYFQKYQDMLNTPVWNNVSFKKLSVLGSIVVFTILKY